MDVSEAPLRLRPLRPTDEMAVRAAQRMMAAEDFEFAFDLIEDRMVRLSGRPCPPRARARPTSRPRTGQLPCCRPQRRRRRAQFHPTPAQREASRRRWPHRVLRTSRIPARRDRHPDLATIVDHRSCRWRRRRTAHLRYRQHSVADGDRALRWRTRQRVATDQHHSCEAPLLDRLRRCHLIAPGSPSRPILLSPDDRKRPTATAPVSLPLGRYRRGCWQSWTTWKTTRVVIPWVDH